MGGSFGARLRQERLSRHLTQDELGGELYSANYISLLENADREPTAEIIRQLASRLQLSGQQQPEPSSPAELSEPSSPETGDYLRLSLCARQSWDTRDYSGAAASARSAAELALACTDPMGWWNMTLLAANSALRNGEHQHAATVLESLLSHPLTSGSDALSLRAHQVMGAAMLAQGRLEESISHAALAVEIGSGDSPEEFSAYLMALQTLVGALAEAGRLDEAWVHAEVLANSVTADTPAQVAGEIHWVVGNVAFIRRDVRLGLEHHTKAAQLLSPTADLSRWAQFTKATAWVRLSAGVVEPATLQALENSELAHSVVGANPAEIMEVSMLRARWHYLNGELAQALELLTAIERDQDRLAPHIAGDTALLLGDTLRESQLVPGARDAYRRAHGRFTQAGALDRAAVAAGHLASLDTP